MAYSLRSRKYLSSPGLQEQTDTPVSNLTEHQVTTQSQIPLVPRELSEMQSAILPTQEANPIQFTSDISAKPDMESYTQQETTGPIRLDPGLISSATLLAGIPSASTHINTQELAPTQASAFVPQSTDLLPSSILLQ